MMWMLEAGASAAKKDYVESILRTDLERSDNIKGDADDARVVFNKLLDFAKEAMGVVGAPDDRLNVYLHGNGLETHADSPMGDPIHYDVHVYVFVNALGL